jgi:hypothetical protein
MSISPLDTAHTTTRQRSSSHPIHTPTTANTRLCHVISDVTSDVIYVDIILACGLLALDSTQSTPTLDLIPTKKKKKKADLLSSFLKSLIRTPRPCFKAKSSLFYSYFTIVCEFCARHVVPPSNMHLPSQS